MESEKCHLSGIIIRDYSNTVSNYRSAKPLSQYLEEQGVMGASPVVHWQSMPACPSCMPVPPGQCLVTCLSIHKLALLLDWD